MTRIKWNVRGNTVSTQMTIPARLSMQPMEKTLLYDTGWLLVVDDGVEVDEEKLLGAIQKKKGCRK